MNLSQFSLIPIRYLIETNKQAFPEVFLFDVSTGPDLSDAAASICSDYGWSHDTCIALAEAFGAIRKIYSDLYSRFNTDYPLGEMTTLELAVPLGSRLFVDRVKYLRGSGTTWVQDYAAMLCAELSVLGKDAIAIAATLIDLIYECEANLQFEHAGMTHPTSDETDFPRFESIYVPRVDHATEKSRALLLYAFRSYHHRLSFLSFLYAEN
ncbi:hypothetical protein BLNAU_22523 [Blattamonas nauphoetae]|uniref:Uncharacterized protein n=1 Tax=Blattamonas nauphoetae TaxID=2049346 RepID=A0ABQ9WSV0_9EUKA|nr:hypothetical protein BLNAU_22523 [Blattamonas nauphoetae]